MTPPHPDEALISRAWRDYFLANQPAEGDLPWDDPCTLSAAEKRAIQRSIQQFQLGENAQGRRLLDGGRAYGLASGDPQFAAALSAFIKEEQRHSAHLLRFMTLQGIPPVAAHWVDSSFRWLRNLAGLEVSLRTLVTAEIIAVPYYRALRGATRSPLLRAICARILKDEAVHLRFQASMLSRIGARRSRVANRAIFLGHRALLLGTVLVVWREHGAMFVRAGYSSTRLLRESLREFRGLEKASFKPPGGPPRTAVGRSPSLYSEAGMLDEEVHASHPPRHSP